MQQLPRISRAAVAVSICIALLLAFQFTMTQDRSVPIGTHASFTISTLPGDATKSQALKAILSAAQRESVNIYKVTVDPTQVGSGRVLFSFIGNVREHAALFPGDRYPNFDPRYSTSLLPFDAMGTQDVRGLFVTTADLATAQRLIADLRKTGFHAAIATGPGNFLAIRTLDDSGAGPVALAALLGLLLALGYSISHQRKIFAVKAIHGFTSSRTLVGVLRPFSEVYWSSAILLGLASALGLLIYNGGAQFGEFAVTAAAALTVTYIAGMVAQAIMFTAAPSKPDVRYLKGARPLAFLLVLAVTVQTLVLGVGYSVLSDTARLYISTAADEAQSDSWLDAGGVVSVRFGGFNTQKDFDDLTPSVGALYRTEEGASRAILAYHSSAPLELQSGFGPDRGNSLIVNNVYLSLQDVRAADGKRIENLAEGPGVIYLLIPEHLRPTAQSIEADFRAFAEFQVSLGTAPFTASINTLYTADNQMIFNYGSLSSMEHTSQADPVIAVIPAASGVLSDDFYLGAITTANAMFTDAETVRAEIRAGALESHILSIDSVSDQALASIDRRHGQIAAYIAGIVMILLVMVFSTGVLASIYCDRNKQSLFTKYTLGWTFLRTHGAYLLGIFLFSGTILLCCTALGLVTSAVGYGVAAGALVLNLMAAVIMVRIYQTQFRGDFVCRY
jgi:putative ABC transport system permease protein